MIPRPPVVQYAPISMLPVRMCTVSHCHTILQGHYPYRRCERHRLQNRHHSKLKRVRDKEVKSTPLRGEMSQEPDSVESGKGKARAVESLYPNEEDSSLDGEIDGAGMSEVCLPFFIVSIPITVSTSTRTSSTRAPFHLLLVAPVVQIRSAQSSGVRMCFIIAHRGRCATPIGREIV
jgi:hypothetical protein